MIAERIAGHNVFPTDHVVTNKEAKKLEAEIERLQRAAWQCWKRDTMTKQEAELMIGVPSI